MVNDHSASEETCCFHYIAARILLYAPSHRKDSTSHGFVAPVVGALAKTRSSSVSSSWIINPMTHHTVKQTLYHRAISHSLWPNHEQSIQRPIHTMSKHYHRATSHSLWPNHEQSIQRPITQWANTTTELHLTPFDLIMNNQSNDPSHNEQTLPQSYISLPLT